MSDVPDGKSLRITSSRSTVWMWCSKFWTPRSVDADTVKCANTLNEVL